MTTGWLKADVWSLGCTVVEMVTGTLPYSYYDNSMTAMYHIASGEVPSFRDMEVSTALKDFVIACCASDPTCRPTAEELTQFEFVVSFTKSSAKFSELNKGGSVETKTVGLNAHIHEGNSTGMDLFSCLDDSMGSDAKSMKPPKPTLRLITPLLVEGPLFMSNGTSAKCNEHIDGVNENDVVPNAALQLQQQIRLQDASTPITTARKGLYNNDQAATRGRGPSKSSFRPPPSYPNLSGKHSKRSDAGNKIAPLNSRQRSNNSSLNPSPHTSAKHQYVNPKNRPISRSDSKAATPDSSIRIRNKNVLSPMRVEVVEMIVNTSSSESESKVADVSVANATIDTNSEGDPTFISSGEMTLGTDLTESGDGADVSFATSGQSFSGNNRSTKKAVATEALPSKDSQVILSEEILESSLNFPQKEELVAEATKISPKSTVPSCSLFDVAPENLSRKLFKMKSDLTIGLSRQSSIRDDDESVRCKESDSSISWGSTILLEAQKIEIGLIQKDLSRPSAPLSGEIKRIMDPNSVDRLGPIELFDMFPSGSLSNKCSSVERLSTVTERCEEYASPPATYAQAVSKETGKLANVSEKRDRYGPSGVAAVRMNAIKESDILTNKRSSPTERSSINSSVSESAMGSARTSAKTRGRKSKKKAYKLNFDGISSAIKTYAEAVGGDTEFSLTPSLSFRSQSAGMLSTVHGMALDGGIGIGNQSQSQIQPQPQTKSQGFLGSFSGVAAFRQEKIPRSQEAVSMSYPKSLGVNLSQHLLPAINLMLPLQRRIIQSAPSLSRSVSAPVSLPPIGISTSTGEVNNQQQNENFKSNSESRIP